MKDILEFVLKGIAVLAVSLIVLVIATGFFAVACLGMLVL